MLERSGTLADTLTTSRRWLGLLLACRALAAVVAVALLAVQHVTTQDELLMVVVLAYAAVSGLLLVRWAGATTSRLFWTVDIAITFGLFCISSDWRSPFYLLGLTALALPAASVGRREAVALAGGYTLAFATAAYLIGPDPLDLGTQASNESLAIHLLLPGLVCLGVGYASDVLRDLETARAESERLAIDAERRRIAWELHDSAKQRIHAAHLLVSSLRDHADPDVRRLVELSVDELRSASADMDTSLAELRTPLEGRPLDEALRERAARLSAAGGPPIEVHGELPVLPPRQAAHVYRIAAEAVTNAVRHADASRIRVDLDARDDDALVTVDDDGGGMPDVTRPGATGILAMHNRARTIDGQLDISTGNDGRGTRVQLSFPIDHSKEAAS